MKRETERTILIVLQAAAVVSLAWFVMHLLTLPEAKGGVFPECRVSSAYATRLWYVPTDDGTSMALIAYCLNADATPWKLTNFIGYDQPKLSDWSEAQNEASRLLRDE